MKYYFALAFFILPHFLQAQETNNLKQDSTDYRYKYYIASGAYFPNVTTEIRLDSQVGLGTVLSLENSFGFPDKPVLFRIDADARITKRSSITAQFFLMNRNSEKVLDREIVIRDTVIETGATIKSKVNNTFYGITYHYDAFRKPMINAGFDAGLRLTVFDMGFYFKRLNGEENATNISLPIPVILLGFHTNGYFTPRLRGGYRFDFFRLNIEGVQGSVFENKFLLEYYFIKNLSIGVAYNSIIYNLDDFPVSDNFTGKVNFQISGMECYLSARF